MGTRYIVSVSEWNKVFASRGRWPFISCHVFVDYEKGKAKIHFYYTWVAKVVMGLLFPVLVVTEGFRDAVKTVKDGWFQCERGAFSADSAVAGRSDWDRLMKLIGHKDAA